MPRDMAYLLDILLHAKDTQNFTKDMNEDAFLSDHKCQMAVVRCLEVMGEAVKRLSEEIQKTHPDIPWSSIAKMRDILIHAYDSVDMAEVWGTVKYDIPPLILALERIIPSEDEIERENMEKKI